MAIPIPHLDAQFAPSRIPSHIRKKSTLHALDGWSAKYKQYANQDTHIVDLVITFRLGGPVN